MCGTDNKYYTQVENTTHRMNRSRINSETFAEAPYNDQIQTFSVVQFRE